MITKEKVKALWKLCFDDPDEFVDMYFNLRYKSEINVTIASGDEVISALQMIPYPMTFCNKLIATSYISGACTHPDFRGRGVMRQLLSQAFTRMQQNRFALSTLIPAEPWLFDYYASNGYAPVFRYGEETFKPRPDAYCPVNLILEKAGADRPEAYEYLSRKLSERPCCIQHTYADYRVILADLQLSGGHVYLLTDKKEIVALAIAKPAGDKWKIDELVYDSPQMRYTLLHHICRDTMSPSLQILTPPRTGQKVHTLGMARIVNAATVLQHYAAVHPELDINLIVTDEQMGSNNGYYYLSNGKCMASAKRLPGSHLALTIGELTEKIFSTLNPYMSLMLN